MNLPAGTIVDQAITSSDLFDFYLIGSQVISKLFKKRKDFNIYSIVFEHSQTFFQGIQGTSIPTHYRVCHDDNNLHVDSAQVIIIR